MPKVAVVFPLSLEPRSLGTYRALHSAIESCEPWIKKNFLNAIPREYEVDLFCAGNYEDWHAHLTTKNLIERKYQIKEFISEPWDKIIFELGESRPNRYWKQLLQPRNLVRALEQIHFHHGEYDYYIKMRFDVFCKMGFDWDAMIEKIHGLGEQFGYDDSFCITGQAINTGNRWTPLYISDTILVFNDSAAQKIISGYDEWVDYTTQLFDTERGIQMPELNYANLFYNNKIFLYEYHTLAGPLYRLYTYQNGEQLQHYIDNINENSYRALTAACEADYINGLRSIELQGGDSNAGFPDKYN